MTTETERKTERDRLYDLYVTVETQNGRNTPTRDEFECVFLRLKVLVREVLRTADGDHTESSLLRACDAPAVSSPYLRAVLKELVAEGRATVLAREGDPDAYYVYVETERDNLYAAYAASASKSRYQHVPRWEFDKKFEEGKAWILKRMATRRCPMTLEGAAKVSGGYSIIDTQDRPTGRFRVAINELVAEGQLIETHRPDGNDTYHIPGGTWDPVLVSPAEADLITDVLEGFRDDPRIAELVERLKLEATARSGRA